LQGARVIESIHIHEDDWAMRALHPIAVAQQITGDLEAAKQAALENRSPDGAGWTNVHLIAEPTLDYSAFNLPISKIAEVLEPILPRVRKFTATASAGFTPGVVDPYGSYDADAYCFALSQDCFIKCEVMSEAPTRVKSIWYEARDARKEALSKLRSAFQAIDALCPSVIADYWLDLSGEIANNTFLSAYFETLEEN
jgi:hypothetical protein